MAKLALVVFFDLSFFRRVTTMKDSDLQAV